MSEPTLSVLTRLWFSLACLLRVLFDGAFAARVWSVRSAAPALPAAGDDDTADDDDDEQADDEPQQDPAAARRADAAQVAPLQLLALLQREGRLVDFLQQDVTDFDDAEVGAAARVVHEGCRRALRAHATIEAIRAEEEDTNVRVEKGFDRSTLKLTGKVEGKPPYSGLLRHRGWRVTELRLPEALAGHDFRVVAPAEVEL